MKAIGTVVSLAGITGAFASDHQVELRGTNPSACGFSKILDAARRSEEDSKPDLLRKAIEETNWNPCCVSTDIKSWLVRNRRPVNGFAAGLDVGIGPLLGYSGGREIVVFRKGADAVEIAVFRYNGVSASLSLPIGLSLTQSVVLDRCEDITSYSGAFVTGQIAGMAKSYGVTSESGGTLTGCNSVSLISGASTSLVGASTTYFSLESETYELRGERVRGLAEFFRRANLASQGVRGEFRAEDFSAKGCEDRLPLQFGTERLARPQPR